MPTTLSPPLKFHGGKHYLADRIISLMPPHNHYVEPYFGGGQVLLRKDPEGVSEVVNDINDSLSNFWIVLQDKGHFQEFLRSVEAIPFSQLEFNAAALYEGDDIVEAAVLFFIRARQSRQGLMKDFATLSRNRTRRGMNEQVSSWLTAIEGLPDVHARLQRVVILQQDGVKTIEQQDGTGTLFYLDPTYLHETRVTTDDYEFEMSKEDHHRLLFAIQAIRGKFILSGYRSRLYDAYAKDIGWHRVDIEIDNKASSKKVKDKKIECLWVNYEPSQCQTHQA